MNFNLDHIPQRTKQPRQNGLTMVMDKGLGIRQAEDLRVVGDKGRARKQRGAGGIRIRHRDELRALGKLLRVVAAHVAGADDRDPQHQ